jgi:hypothetical protein
VQPIQVADLKGTAAYDKLQAAWEAGAAVPKLVVTLVKDVEEGGKEDQWGATLDETIVHIGRVIAYWSRSLKSAERNYSEQVILVTDHAAL